MGCGLELGTWKLKITLNNLNFKERFVNRFLALVQLDGDALSR